MDLRREITDRKAPLGIIRCGHGVEDRTSDPLHDKRADGHRILGFDDHLAVDARVLENAIDAVTHAVLERERNERSEEHTSELQSLMRISYAVFCLKKKTKTK